MLIKMLLTTVIQGGLGNQLFEVFSLLNLVKKYGYDYIIEKKDTSHSITPRYTYWNKIFKNLNLSDNIIHNFQGFKESDNNIYINIPKFSINTKLEGYFQSDKYLTEIRNDIFNYLTLSEDDNNIVENYYQNLKNEAGNKPLVFIHIRRGDYIKLAHFHYNLSLFYYMNALSKFDMDATHFVFFSDDLEYCKENFDFVKYKSFVNLEDYLSLFLMSKMDGAIIANSSFSWWGAYLMEIKNSNCKVIQPSRWFTTLPLKPNDRIRDNWITVNDINDELY
jgi:hypothetical protein